MAERTTEQNVSSHRRYVVRSIISALRDVFNSSYDRDPQLANLKVTQRYPLVATDYPCVVIDYEPQKVVNAGVGHEEWFTDSQGVMRKWHHSRFEGTVNFECYGLSPLDRDILADALTEVIRFGRLDAQLDQFFTDLYGDPNADVELIFNQIMFNADEVDFGGNSEAPAPWQPEDKLTYSTELSSIVHGGYYNVVPNVTWQYVTKIVASPYEEEVDLTLPFDDPETVWTNPFVFEDLSIATSKSSPSAVEYLSPYFDSNAAMGIGVPSTSDEIYGHDLDFETVIGEGIVFATDHATFVDAATAQSIGFPSSGTDEHDRFETETTVSRAVISAVDEFAGQDAGLVQSVGVVSGADSTSNQNDAATVVSTAVVSSVDERDRFDSGTVVSVAVISSSDNLTNDTDFFTVIGIAHVSSTDERDTYDSGFVASVGVPSDGSETYNWGHLIGPGMTVWDGEFI